MRPRVATDAGQGSRGLALAGAVCGATAFTICLPGPLFVAPAGAMGERLCGQEGRHDRGGAAYPHLNLPHKIYYGKI